MRPHLLDFPAVYIRQKQTRVGKHCVDGRLEVGAECLQDYCIECPSTGSLFDLRTGEIKDWCVLSQQT